MFMLFIQFLLCNIAGLIIRKLLHPENLLDVSSAFCHVECDVNFISWNVMKKALFVLTFYRQEGCFCDLTL